MVNEFKSEIIENYLKENKISKSKFCKMCGISPCTLNRIIKNKNYKIIALFKIARVIKIQVHKMFKVD